MTDGILIVDKPGQMTSHDVVAAARRALRIKKIGHTGTLDPMATGVLALVIGKATRLSRYLTGHDKRYQATIKLGETTDTMDAEGQITATAEVAVEQQAVYDAVASFQGDIEQLPPMYSAKKVGGKRLYELARKGIEVEREPKQVSIYDITITDISLPFLTCDVHCSSGTYIRVLASDIGQKLGCGAHLTALRRTAVGPFSISQAVSLDTVKEQGTEALSSLLPMDEALPHLPNFELHEILARRVIQGEDLRVKDIARFQLPDDAKAGDHVTLRYQGRLLAIAHLKAPALAADKAPAHLAAVHPERVFVNRL